MIENITNEDWNDFYLFYSITYAVRGQRPYLTSAFFKDLKSLKPIILFAHKGGQRIAAALFFRKILSCMADIGVHEKILISFTLKPAITKELSLL